MRDTIYIEQKSIGLSVEGEFGPNGLIFRNGDQETTPTMSLEFCFLFGRTLITYRPFVTIRGPLYALQYIGEGVWAVTHKDTIVQSSRNVYQLWDCYGYSILSFKP